MHKLLPCVLLVVWVLTPLQHMALAKQMETLSLGDSYPIEVKLEPNVCLTYHLPFNVTQQYDITLMAISESEHCSVPYNIK